MEQKWFHRLLYSYLHVFFVIVTALIAIFFIALIQQTREQARKVNEHFTVNLMQSIDSAFANIDYLLTDAMKRDDWIQNFMERKLIEYPDNRYVTRLSRLAAEIPLVDSIYLYRLSDQIVMSQFMELSLEQFGDREFIRTLIDQNFPPSVWKGQREYKEFVNDSKNHLVFSMVKYVGEAPNIKGIIVVNVKVERILELVRNMLGDNLGTVEIIDSDSNVLLRQGNFSNANRDIFGQTVSNYTNWRIQGSITGEQLISYISILVNVWFVIGIAIILMGCVWIFVVTRRNYRPLQAIIQRFEHYERKLKEDIVIRKQHFFLKIVDGEQPVSQEEWEKELPELGMDPKYGELGLAIAEIDQYNDFCEIFPPKDQLLMKFTLANVANDFSRRHGYGVWTEWVSPHQMGMIFFLPPGSAQSFDPLKYICDDIHLWVQQNLKFTVTFGIGGIISAVPDIQKAYSIAQDVLKYKAVLGSNRVIGPWDIQCKTEKWMTGYIPQIQLMVQAFRLGEPEWKTRFFALFDSMRKDFLARDDIATILNYLIFQFYRDTTQLHGDIQTIWNQHAIPKLQHIIESFDTLEELRDDCFSVLTQTLELLESLRRTKGNIELVAKIRAYIEQNYQDCNLSLLSVSEEFQISPSYLSRLFKETVGEKFVHYLTRVRIENAKKMLRESDRSVQEIAMEVGYVHPFSFIRTFKKITGITPGEYRKGAEGKTYENVLGC